MNEKILEVKWALEKDSAGFEQDFRFPVFLERFHKTIEGKYTEMKKLPSARIPDVMIPYVVKYRFRGEQEMPVIQIGTGLAILNFDESYRDTEYLEEAIYFYDALFQAHDLENSDTKLKFSHVCFRYVNVIDRDLKERNVFKEIASKFRVNASFPDGVLMPFKAKGKSMGFQMSVNCALDDNDLKGGEGLERLGAQKKQC